MAWKPRLQRGLSNSFKFLEEFDLFATVETGRRPRTTRTDAFLFPPIIQKIYVIYSVKQVFRNRVILLSCGFDRPPLRDAVNSFLTDLEHIANKMFDSLVEQAAHGGLLDLTHYIDSTDVKPMVADQDASKYYVQPTTSTITATAV